MAFEVFPYHLLFKYQSLTLALLISPLIYINALFVLIQTKNINLIV